MGRSVLCFLCVLVAAASPAAPPSIDAAFQRFWAAHDPQDAGKAVQDIVRSGVAFADAIERLKRGRTKELFPRGRAAGRVDVTRRANAIDMKTRGVAELTLPLSPDLFDFSQPIVVTANGRVVSDQPVEPSVATLAKWAARDNDRTMLFGAELHVSLK